MVSFLQASMQADSRVEADDLKIVHNSIQYLPNSISYRSLFLNLLGHIHSKHYQASHCIDNLDKAVNAYNEAVRDATWNDSLANPYVYGHGVALLRRFKRLGKEDDIVTLFSKSRRRCD